MSDDPQQKKVVNLAEARQRQQTLRSEQKAKGGARQGASGSKQPAKPQPRIWVYLQLVVFLAIVSYMMTLCRH